MAGRSGSAAIEVAFREATMSFDAHALARQLRVQSAADPPLRALADALDALSTPTVHRSEGEWVLQFHTIDPGVPLSRHLLGAAAHALNQLLDSRLSNLPTLSVYYHPMQAWSCSFRLRQM